MKCLKRSLTYVLSLLLISYLFKVAFALTLTKEQLEKVVQKELIKLYPNAVLVSLTLYSSKIYLPDRPLVFDVQRTKSGFFLNIEDPLTGKTFLTVPLKVAFKEKVPVAAVDINPGEIITPEKVQFEERVIKAFARKKVATDPFGKEAKVLIPKGAIIYKRYIEKLTVKAGKRVVVEFIKGALLIKTYGILLDNGKIGQTVRVKRGNKVFFGRLKDENTVLVELP